QILNEFHSEILKVSIDIFKAYLDDILFYDLAQDMVNDYNLKLNKFKSLKQYQLDIELNFKLLENEKLTQYWHGYKESLDQLHRYYVKLDDYIKNGMKEETEELFHNFPQHIHDPYDINSHNVNVMYSQLQSSLEQLYKDEIR